MNTPMNNKSPQVIQAIEDLFPGTSNKIKNKVCPACDNPVGEFKDDLSIREYLISGMCQACQDDVFREEDE